MIDDVLKVSDQCSIATLYWLEKLLGRRTGASTGTNVWGALQLAKQMHEQQQTGSIVTLICDSGERYPDTYYNPQWVADNIGDLTDAQATLPKW